MLLSYIYRFIGQRFGRPWYERICAEGFTSRAEAGGRTAGGPRRPGANLTFNSDRPGNLFYHGFELVGYQATYRLFPR